MKISIITVCFNSEKTLEKTINSVLSQNYKNIEYIIIDGGSEDSSLKIIDKYKDNITTIISEKDNGIYDGINKGIQRATGDVISLIHSNDMFVDENVISKIVNFFKSNSNFDIILADLAFKKKLEDKKITRYYSAKNFRPWMLRIGYSPPHLSAFFKTDIFKKVGLYKANFRIAGDFDFFVKCFLKHKIKFNYLEECLIFMSTGGKSGKNFLSYLISSKEINQSLKSNNIYSNIFITFLRFPFKLIQFILR
jgi:glycosyltransferase involved in cell wall biosynthesis